MNIYRRTTRLTVTGVTPNRNSPGHVVRGYLASTRLRRLELSAAHHFDHPRPLFDARISGLSIFGGLASNSFALAKSALAISPFRCAFRPFSSAKVSKMPYFPGPILMAYHVTVPGSFSARGCADFRN